MTAGAGSVVGNSGGGGTSSRGGGSSVDSAGSLGSSGSGESIGMPPNSAGHTQLAMMTGNILTSGSDFFGPAPGTAPKKALNGPILFERMREADGAPSPSVLRGRVLRAGASPVPNEGSVSISKVGCSVRVRLLDGNFYHDISASLDIAYSCNHMLMYQLHALC